MRGRRRLAPRASRFFRLSLALISLASLSSQTATALVSKLFLDKSLLQKRYRSIVVGSIEEEVRV